MSSDRNRNATQTERQRKEKYASRDICVFQSGKAVSFSFFFSVSFFFLKKRRKGEESGHLPEAERR